MSISMLSRYICDNPGTIEKYVGKLLHTISFR